MRHCAVCRFFLLLPGKCCPHIFPAHNIYIEIDFLHDLSQLKNHNDAQKIIFMLFCKQNKHLAYLFAFKTGAMHFKCNVEEKSLRHPSFFAEMLTLHFMHYLVKQFYVENNNVAQLRF